MRDIGKKMTHDMADAFLWLEVLLAASGTISFFHGSPAVETGLVMAKMMTAHFLLFLVTF